MTPLSKYISHVKDLHSLNEYIAESKTLHQNVNIAESKTLHQNVNINEKLLINKHYKGVNKDIFIPDNIHINGVESLKNVIYTIEDCYGINNNHVLIYDMFSSLNCDSFEYTFFDGDTSDPNNKILDKIFPNGIEYYKNEHKNNEDDYIPLNNNESDYHYLIKLNTTNKDNKNTIIVWVYTEKENKYVYIFWRAKI